MTDKQPGWELALFGSSLHQGLASADAAYQAYLRGDRDDGPEIATPVNIYDTQDWMNSLTEIVNHVSTILTPARMESAMGEEGRQGDEAAIVSLASDLTSAFNQLLGWARHARSVRVPEPFTRTFTAVSHMADAPMRDFHDFATTCAASSAAIAADLAAGRTPTHTLQLTLTITQDDAVMKEFNDALEELAVVTKPRGILSRLFGK